MQIQQKKYKVQYEYINEKFEADIKTKSDNNENFEENDVKKKHVILDPSKKYSIISFKRLKSDGIDENKLSFNFIGLTEDVKDKNIRAKLELNLLIGKEKIEKKILVYVSDELNEEFYLGNDFLSSYS